MFRPAIGKPENLEHLQRVERFTRDRFALCSTDLVIVSEEVSRKPGFPPLETLVVFWTQDGQRYRFRIFKAVAQVDAADIPIAWMLPSLLDDGTADCC
jgi:nitrate reductase delta subunit